MGLDPFEIKGNFNEVLAYEMTLMTCRSSRDALTQYNIDGNNDNESLERNLKLISFQLRFAMSFVCIVPFWLKINTFIQRWALHIYAIY